MNQEDTKTPTTPVVVASASEDKTKEAEKTTPTEEKKVEPVQVA